MSRIRRDQRTWQKLDELENEGDKIKKAYVKILAEAIDWRIKNNITQADISLKTGLSYSTISKIETQYSSPTIANFLLYLSAIGFDLKLSHKHSK